MKVCPQCKTLTLLDTDSFCYKDGTPLIAQPVCACGRELSEGIDKFCPKCGARVEVVEVPF
jgi:hypothetical protein